MKTVIIGAEGFVGRALGEALEARGDRVGRVPEGGVPPEEYLSDETALAAAMRGAEVVFHLARIEGAEVPRARCDAVNLTGTENVLGACRSAGVRRLVFLSSEAVTRGSAHRSYVDEKLPQAPRFSDESVETLALAEDLVVAASGSGIETVTLRPGVLWGPGDTDFLPALVARAKRGSLRWIDGGRSLAATTHVKNLVEGLLRAGDAEGATGKVYYLTDDERLSWREFATRALATAGVTAPRGSVPYALAWALSRAGLLSRTELLREGRSAHFNIQAARKDLGYAPVVTVDEGMKSLRASSPDGA